MAKPLHLSRVNVLFRRTTLPTTVTPPRFLFVSSNLKQPISMKPLVLRQFSTTRTRYPHQYELIVPRPVFPARPPPRRRSLPPNSDTSFEDFVEQRLTSSPQSDASNEGVAEMDKSKRKYLNKRKRKLLGSDSEDEEYRRRHEDELIEVKQEVVEFKSLQEKEEELFFYDAFCYPWEKNKHYKMMYQLEKKYFPNQGFDKAFLDPVKQNEEQRKSKKKNADKVDEGLMFFEGNNEEDGEKGDVKDVEVAVSEKAVGEFFKCLKKGPNEDAQDEPFLSSRRTGLPARWDTPQGTVLLVNKPKGWTSFTVCGKLRSLVKVKKVGHAGTLDPMATGLLIVCVGKSTKNVDRFQGMIKGYSGIIRLGEATSTWDADSPVIQREPWEHIKDHDLKKAAQSFCGEIWQVPPMFSAIKVGGEKLYEKARRGENIELSPRRVSIFQFDIERSLDDRQNLIFRVICSKGTYIRSLCADLGKALGSCAHLTALRRDSIGEYLAADAWDFKELEENIIKEYM